MSRIVGRSGYSAKMFGAVLALGTLAGCEEGTQLGFLQPANSSSNSETTATTKLVERDVEAPDVFQVNEAGLWDGRPSLGGIWVAHPDVGEPERVIIRNNTNGKFVIGALFRREREIPGPRLQASSDAAAALGMLAGGPVELNVTALRRETVEETPEPAPIEKPGEVETASLPSSDISEATLDPITAAAAAIEAAGPTTEAKPEPSPSAAVAKAAAPAKSPSPLDRPYIQIGIFSVEANANRTAAQMRNAGMLPTIFKEKHGGKSYWRVVAGPAMTKSERSALLKQIREAGFSDAYAVVK
ncbi:MAG: SPOR domain-containing protein [Marinibacterium sp.]|nr:SPOR domain-containing protein [Marinibacterium sp.]